MNSIRKLVRAYNYLSRSVPSSRSGTARLIQSGQSDFALSRLKEELSEALSTRRGIHSHGQAKLASARALLELRGCSTDAAGLLLELTQVSYWCIVASLSRGESVDEGQIIESLKRGSRSTSPMSEFAEEARRNPEPATVFAFVGRMLAESGLPLDIFSEFDLREMAGKSYLKDAILEP